MKKETWLVQFDEKYNLVAMRNRVERYIDHSRAESRSARRQEGLESGERLTRRDFLKTVGFGGAGLLFQAKPYRFDWGVDVPPSLMLHSGNIKYLPELLPALIEDFVPMTYRDWMEKLARLDGVSSLIADIFGLQQAAVHSLLSVENRAKLPLIISIDDVGTDWIRIEHQMIFRALMDRNIPAVVGVQPKVMPDEEGRYWDQVIALHQAGWEVATHSINHPPLTQVNRRTASYEIHESCDRIGEVIGERPITLITPFGDSEPPDDTSAGNKQLYELVQEAGLKVVAGIRGGRQRVPAEIRAELRSVYGGGIPEYVGRIQPDSQVSRTLAYLKHFKQAGFLVDSTAG